MKIITFAHYKSIELNQKNKYYSRFLEAIETNISEFCEEVERDFRIRYGDSNQDEFFDAMLDEITAETEDYDFTLYSSFIMAIYSFLEQTLNQICKHYEKHVESNIRMNDLRGEGVERAYLFIKKVIEVDVQDINSSWEKIKDINKIRNLVVHAGISEINDINNIDKLPKHIKVAQDLELFKVYPADSANPYYGRLYLNYNFCKQSYEDVFEFLQLLLKKLPEVSFIS